VSDPEHRPKRKSRRRRADLSGFKIEIEFADDPSQAQVAYPALYEEFLRWQERKNAQGSERDQRTGAECDRANGGEVAP